jgi:hypothetical protein
VEIDVSGVVVQSGDIWPDCTDFVLLSSGQAEGLSFWSDVSAQLDPSGDLFWPLLGAVLVAYATVAAVRLVVSNIRDENRKA